MSTGFLKRNLYFETEGVPIRVKSDLRIKIEARHFWSRWPFGRIVPLQGTRSIGLCSKCSTSTGLTSELLPRSFYSLLFRKVNPIFREERNTPWFCGESRWFLQFWVNIFKQTGFELVKMRMQFLSLGRWSWLLGYGKEPLGIQFYADSFL